MPTGSSGSSLNLVKMAGTPVLHVVISFNKNKRFETYFHESCILIEGMNNRTTDECKRRSQNAHEAAFGLRRN